MTTPVTEQKMPLEKRILMSKRNLLKEAVIHIDGLLELRSKVREIADDSGLNASFLWGWLLEQMGLTAEYEFVEADDEEDEEDEEEEEEEE